MEQVNQNENIQEQITTYSEWNKLVIPSAANEKKKLFNVLKYGTALLLLVTSLIALWFAAQWQTVNVLSTMGVDVTKWSAYLADNAAGAENATLIAKISGYQLWDLKDAVISKGGVDALVILGIVLLFSGLPLLIFKNGTQWSLGSITLSWILLIAVIVLFSMGLASQWNPVKEIEAASFAQAGEIDKLNAAIATQQSLLITPGESGVLTPMEQIENNIINNNINELLNKKNSITDSFMKPLNDYLIQL
ncbi:MAG: hypothetical protein ACRCXE_02360 [Metamycoplasmataceae bacterium]